MTLALLLAAALIAAGPPSGSELIDLGHAVPGQQYDYVARFVNPGTENMSVAREGSQCGGCPNLQLAYQSLGPGRSVGLPLRLFYAAGANDSATAEIKVVTYSESLYGAWTYRLRMDRKTPALVRLKTKTADVSGGPDGLLTTAIGIKNISRHDLLISGEGLPDSVRFPEPYPVPVKRGKTGTFMFHCAPEVLLNHRSVTLKIFSETDPTIVERVSLPLVVK